MKPFVLIAAALALLLSPAAIGQDEDAGRLLISPGDMGGVCSCTEMTPPPSPYDCDAVVSQIRSDADAQRREMTGQCVTDQMQRCVAQQGDQACEALPEAFRAGCNPVVQGRLACASLEPQMSEQCGEAIQAVFDRDVGPVLRQQRAVCEAQNDQVLAPWRQWCEEVERPQACGACTSMTDEIAETEAELQGHRTWVEEMRTGLLMTEGDDNAMTERLAEIDRLENQLAQRRANYEIMQVSGYCE